MNELPLNIQRAIDRYDSIEIEGLTLHPVLVSNYDEFLMARPALEVLHQSLPVAMMRMPLLSALYRMDFETARDGKPPIGLFSRALLGLALSLRLGEGLEAGERVRLFRIAVEREKPEILARLQFTDHDGTEKEIMPAMYKQLRSIIAAQNGVEIESDKANPDIVRAKKQMSEGSIALDANISDLISAVAALSGAEEAQIEGWPILKLEKRSEAYRRILDYLVCGVGQVSGMTSWKGGNPTPHPFFKRSESADALFTPVSPDGGNMEAHVTERERELARAAENL